MSKSSLPTGSSSTTTTPTALPRPGGRTSALANRMKSLFSLFSALLLAGCSHSTTTVRVSDAENRPISGFPLHFELDQGLQHTNALGMSKSNTLPSNPNGLLLEGELTRIDERTFGTRTNSKGIASISYTFKERQPAGWRVLLLNAKELPDQSVDVIPLRDLPRGSRISVATPNP